MSGIRGHRNGPPPQAGCFVLMPFADEFDHVYHRAIRPGAEAAAGEVGVEMSVKRADEYTSPSHITRDIIETLCHCNCAVADLTGGNPNVFYELGVIHAMGDKTVLIAQNLDRLPFDLRDYRVLPYSTDEAGLTRLRAELAESLVSVLQRKPGSSAPRSSPVSDFAPVRLSDVTITIPEAVAFERGITDEIWVLGPDAGIDLRDYVQVIRDGILQRSVAYKYILPDTVDADRSWRLLEEAVALPESARSLLLRKVVPEHVIESELVIYSPRSREEAVFLIPAADEDEHVYIRLPRTRATAVRRRFERLWDE